MKIYIKNYIYHRFNCPVAVPRSLYSPVLSFDSSWRRLLTSEKIQFKMPYYVLVCVYVSVNVLSTFPCIAFVSSLKKSVNSAGALSKIKNRQLPLAAGFVFHVSTVFA